MPAHRSSPARRRLAMLRLAAQCIGAGEPGTPVAAVRWMLALQAQDLPGARWSVGLRHAGSSEPGVNAAFDAAEIVRSWPLRGTLHVVAGEDLGWMLGLTASRAIASAARRRAALGLADADLERAREAAARALAGGRPLAREDLLAAIEAGGVVTAGQRGYHLLWYLAQAGTIVLGPMDGRQQAFVLLDAWVRHPRRLERDEALGELALRYFRSHGPATPGDLARWAGLTLADVRRGLEVAGARLATVDLDGITYHLAPEASMPAVAPARVHLLPGFDEYVLGYRDRTVVLAPEHSQAVVPGGNGMFRPTIVADGEVVGTWRWLVRAGALVVQPEPFGRLPAWALAGLDDAARAYGSFRGLPARLADPTTGGQATPTRTAAARSESSL